MALLDAIFLGGLVTLLIGAALRLRARLREPLVQPLLDDAAIRSIEATGTVEVDDETLDLSTIEDEERRFWEEGEPDEERWE